MINLRGHTGTFNFRSCVVIVAHPDDETLWAGGTILMNPQCEWTVITLCRKSDPDRSPRFFRALKQLNATGAMGDIDDGPQQSPLDDRNTQNTIVGLLATSKFNLIITHGLQGEYTRHLRHEETAKSVLTLWENGKLPAEHLWMFAYEDGGRKYLPRPVDDPDMLIKLPKEIWQKKYDIITDTYGFGPDSFEAKAVPRQEAFRCFRRPAHK